MAGQRLTMTRNYFWFKGAVLYNGVFFNYNGPVEIDDNHYFLLGYLVMFKLCHLYGDFYELEEAIKNPNLAGKGLLYERKPETSTNRS